MWTGRPATRGCAEAQASTSSACVTGARTHGLRGTSRWPRAGHASLRPAALVLNVSTRAMRDDEDEPWGLEIPTRFELQQRPDTRRPTVRVRLSVHYRVHSRQMLCIGGSQMPLGWSFLSIAKVPMTWNAGDVWTCEVDLQAGQRIEYKYVILEEQDWTKLENDDAQGLVEINYRTGSEPGKPPDVGVIQKQMAIVAWQPGPNRVLMVPAEAELLQLKVGETIERIPARPQQRLPYDPAMLKGKGLPPLKPDPFEGTWEVLTMTEDGKPFVDRHDVWGWVPTAGARPANNLKGFNFGPSDRG